MNHYLFTLFECIVIIMLIVITWRQDSIDLLFKCSRDRSKIVRDVIYKKFIPIFIRHKTNISFQCPFHPDREILWWPMSDIEHNNDNNLDDHNQWTCPICGINLHCPDRLIFHWDVEHRYSRPYREEFICLADYCDIFRCDIIITKKMLQQKKHFFNYLSFDENKNSATRIDECDSQNMVILHQMCLDVIEQCMNHNDMIVDMNISTIQTLSSIRKELIEKICSYLTCEHYNDDDDIFNDESTISRKVPIILFTIVGLIMFSGFILIYHFIWHVFSRNFQVDNDNDESKKLTSDSLEKFKNNDSSFSKMNENLKRKTNLKQKNVRLKKKSISASYDKFFQNIFEFNHGKYDDDDDSFEWNELEQNQVSKFEAKLHAINSIIEEENEEEESEFDISVHSYPNINRKNLRRIPRKIKLPNKDNDTTITKQSQEIRLQELPMKFHPKYVQPIKQQQSYSDRYPCYTDRTRSQDSFTMLSNKLRSFSHSHLKNVNDQNLPARMVSKNPRRQYSIDEEEWDPHQSQLRNRCCESHSNPALQNLNAKPIYFPNTNRTSNQLLSTSSLPLSARYKPLEWNESQIPPSPPPPPQQQQHIHHHQQHQHQQQPQMQLQLQHQTSTPFQHRPISKSALSYHMIHPSRELYAKSKTNSDASIGSGCSSRYSNPTILQ